MNGKRALSNNLTIPHYRFMYDKELNKCERVKEQNIFILSKWIKFDKSNHGWKKNQNHQFIQRV